MSRFFEPPDRMLPADFRDRHMESASALPPVKLPRDELAQDTNMEWWYFVAHLQAANTGEQISVMLSAIRGKFPLSELTTCLLKVTDHQRGSWPLADSGGDFGECYTGEENPVGFELRYEGGAADMLWRPVGRWVISGGPTRYQITAVVYNDRDRTTPDLDLEFHSVGPAMLLSGDGIVDYGGGHELAYYLRPKMTVRGRARLGNRIANVTGTGWYERQWGALPWGEFGWKYHNINLDDGEQWLVFHSLLPGHERYMAARFPSGGGMMELPLTAQEFQHFSMNGRPLGTRLMMDLPEGKLDLTITPLFPDEPEIKSRYPFVPQFWEGPARVEGTRAGKQVAGLAMTELKSYA